MLRDFSHARNSLGIGMLVGAGLGILNGGALIGTATTRFLADALLVGGGILFVTCTTGGLLGFFAGALLDGSDSLEEVLERKKRSDARCREAGQLSEVCASPAALSVARGEGALSKSFELHFGPQPSLNRNAGFSEHWLSDYRIQHLFDIAGCVHAMSTIFWLIVSPRQMASLLGDGSARAFEGFSWAFGPAVHLGWNEPRQWIMYLIGTALVFLPVYAARRNPSNAIRGLLLTYATLAWVWFGACLLPVQF